MGYVIALRRLGGPPLQIQALPQFIDPTIDAKAENGSVEALPQKRKSKGPADEPRDCALKIIIPGVNFRRGRADNRVPLKNQWEQRDLPASEQAVVNQEGKNKLCSAGFNGKRGAGYSSTLAILTCPNISRANPASSAMRRAIGRS